MSPGAETLGPRDHIRLAAWHATSPVHNPSQPDIARLEERAVTNAWALKLEAECWPYLRKAGQ